MREPISIAFFHDVLCPWCFVAAERLRVLKAELGDAVEVVLRPYLLRPEEEPMTPRELTRVVRHARRASREPEGRDLHPALWKGSDRPLSSLPPLVAAQAALHQGQRARDAFLLRMRQAAHVQGINVARTDVLLELASATGLDVREFVRAFESPTTRKAIETSTLDAVRRGVRAVPAVSLGDEWILTGVRSLAEYRDALRRWREERGGGVPERGLH
jgi:predicted DsbA family dithiol-disulfide isomerase